MPPKPPLTHFLCLPLVNPSSRPHLQASISRFTSEVTTADNAGQTPVPPKAVRPIGAMHFTIGVMSLLTPERLEAACSFLRGLDLRALLREEAGAAVNTQVTEGGGDQPSRFKMTLSGLHPMQSTTKTSSLYIAPSDSPHAMTPFCLDLQSAFRTAGFLLPDTRPLKLHATIVNTIYTKEARSGKKRWSKDSGKIDAMELIEKYKDYEWVRGMRNDRIAICEMGAKKIMEGEDMVDQVYTEVVSIPLP